MFSKCSGAPYDACNEKDQLYLNEGEFCGTLWCANTAASCYYFRMSGQVETVDDGVPCPISSASRLDCDSCQCMEGTCVDSQAINAHYQWVAGKCSFILYTAAKHPMSVEPFSLCEQ